MNSRMIGLLLIFSLLLTACGGQEDTWQSVQDSGVLKVGLDPTYPPFEVFNGEEVVGIDADLATALAEELGVEVEFVHFGYDGLYDALLTKQADILISALVVTPERMKDFTYSEPYFNAGENLIVRDSETEIEGMADLNGSSLSVELGSQGHLQASEWERKLPNLTILPFNTPDEALTAVLDKKADAALIDHISGRLFIKEQPGLRRIEEPITVEPYAIVLRAEDNQLLDVINNSLERLQNSGELNKIKEEWLGS